MSAEEHSTRTTVLVAGGVNLFVAAIKVTAGILTGSSALLAEAAHSAADTLNQVFLLASIRQGRRPADARHPFGYGQERYFWSLLAAFGIFVAGAGFSVFEGVLALTRPDHGQDAVVGYVVLAVAGLAEATSFARALLQSRGQARSRHLGLVAHLRTSADTTVKAALFEDSAAMVGLALAAAGLLLRQLTGSPAWDGSASIAIGALLVVVAVRLGLDSRDLLLGRAADPRDQQLIRDRIEELPGVDELLELLTMYMGPDRLIVAARVAFSDQIDAGAVEGLAERIDRELSGQLSATPHVFIDPTDTASGSRGSGLREPLLPGSAD
ncbi:MAG: cation diffusion facilitator family transporter [Actinomycetota bacterium]|nr:cation diffusion facilitator family transporter [Actinomycetota bacterium]